MSCTKQQGLTGRSTLALAIILTVGLIVIIKLYGHAPYDFQTKKEVEGYTKHSKLQWDWALSSLESYPFRGDESVLDIGSGDGKFSAEIATHVPDGRVIGLDISPAMVNYASSNYSRSLYRNLLFLQGDATQNPFSEQFDLIVSFCAMHFIEDQPQVLMGIKKALSPGGKALLVMPEDYDYNLSPVSERLAKTDKWRPYFESLEVPVRYYKSAGDYRTYVSEAGLHTISIKSIMIDDHFASRKALVEWILTISSFAKALPPDKQREFAEEVAEGMLFECPPPKSDGSLILRSPKLEVWVEKRLSQIQN